MRIKGLVVALACVFATACFEGRSDRCQELIAEYVNYSEKINAEINDYAPSTHHIKMDLLKEIGREADEACGSEWRSL